MATTTGTCTVFDKVKDKIGDNSIDLNTDAFSVMLLTSGWTPDRAANEFVDDIVANEHGATAGYVRKVLANVQWITSGGSDGQMMLNANDPVWTASGASIVCRYWALFDSETGADATRDLIAYGLLDDTPLDVTTTTTNTLTLNINALGFFTVG